MGSKRIKLTMETLKSKIEYRLSIVKRFAEKSFCACKNCNTKWATKLENGEEVYDLHATCTCGCKEYEIKPLIENNDYALQVFEELATAYKAEIHDYLAPLKKKDAETQIRNHIKDIINLVKPIVDGRISVLEKRESQMSRTVNKQTFPLLQKLRKYIARYKELQDDFTALIAFRHFETFCLYIDAIFDNDIFTPALHLFKGFYFYANSMALNGDVKFIEKQCFAGAGKSATDTAFISFLFGLDINNDVLKIFGNKDNVVNTMDMLSSIMCSERYAKVFPYYAKFEGKEESIFAICKKAQGTFKINGSVKSVNLRVRAKGEKTDGVRAKYLFLDDITAADDTLEQYVKDINLYTARWFKRKYDLNNFYIIVSGTTYHQEDILSYLKSIFGVDRAKPTKFKFTHISRSNEITPNGLSVFCVIYGLDENDKSTYEVKFPTEAFILEREKNERNFMAMVQQQPLPPEGAPFDYDNLPNLYGEEGIPHLADRSQEVCRASLDPSRKGKDFNSMPIIVNIDGKEYLKDCIFEQSPPDTLPEKVVDMIQRHHIVHLDIENNTETLFANIIRKLLAERGIAYCRVTDFYSQIKKDIKIRNNEMGIKSIYYPARGVYSPSSPMGKFMYWLTAYNFDKPPKHDDSADSLANYAMKFILNKTSTPKGKVLDRRRR